MKLVKQTSEFLIDQGHHYFNNCHASTLVCLPGSERLLVAFFAGEKEGSGDTAIWTLHYQDGKPGTPVRAIAEAGVAHWNPVLHHQDGRVWLFYKTGSDVHRWVTRYVISDDEGITWSSPQPLVTGDRLPRGPVKNKLLVMSNGEWLAPGSVEDDRYWSCFVDISADRGTSWRKIDVPIEHQQGAAGGGDVWQGLQDDALWETDVTRVFQWDGVIQPSAWESAPGQIHLLMRSTRGRIYRSDSTDYGRSWCGVYPTSLPNNNSGIDVCTDDAGRLLLAFNPVGGNWSRRYPLSISGSADNGIGWTEPCDLETSEGEFSYPAIIVHGGRVYTTYTWNRKNIVLQTLLLVPYTQ